jgi:hypothetical protein
MVKDSKTIAQLKQRIRDLYRMYNKEKYCIPYTRSYLFDQPLLSLQQMKQSSMSSWIQSVEEADATRQSKERLHLELSRTIMGRFLTRNPVTNHSSTVTTRPSSHIASLREKVKRHRPILENKQATTSKPASFKPWQHQLGKANTDTNSQTSDSSTSILHPIWKASSTTTDKAARSRRKPSLGTQPTKIRSVSAQKPKAGSTHKKKRRRDPNSIATTMLL